MKKDILTQPEEIRASVKDSSIVDSKGSPAEQPGTVKSRLLELLREKRMTQTEFARRLGVSPTYIGAMRRSIPDDRMRKLMQIFPDLNRDWLLYGEGEMLNPVCEGPDLSKGYVVPLLPVEAYAGNLSLWSESVALRDCEKVVSPVPGVDFGIRISGDSMEPEFQNGSILFIKRINEKAFIPWGNPMVIDTENGVVVKVVMPGAYEKKPAQAYGEEETDREASDPGNEAGESRMPYIIAKSYNPAYPPFRIPVSSIYSIYRIITGIKQYSTL